MAYVGIGYSGSEPGFLRQCADTHAEWLKADRVPRFYGDDFVVMYDSNTAREFVRKCKASAAPGTLTVYPMDRPCES